MRLTIIALTLLIVSWLSLGTAHTDTAGPWVWDKPVSAAMKAKIQEMGPGYWYRTIDGVFQVNTEMVALEEGWERLKI